MHTRDELASFIATVRGASIMHHKMTPAEMDSKIIELNRFGVLSISALAAVFNTTHYRIEKVLPPQLRPTTRGNLNPSHLPWLGYMVSSAKVNPIWLDVMLDEGTSLSTISDLTNISESTLYRYRRQK